MREIRFASERGHFDFGWLDTHHSFSFGEYQDPAHMGWRSLRVLNEDRVKPGQGFGTHGHQDMEILTWVLEGALEHRDSLGTHGIIRPGEAQVMSAGTGIRHSEFNGSADTAVHFLQIWILPERPGLPPRYDQVAFGEASLRNRWQRIAGADPEPGVVRIFQDLQVSAARLEAGASLPAMVHGGRFGYLHIARGAVDAGPLRLAAGDALKFDAEEKLEIKAERDSEVLLFDLG
jgi:redox-sensitive bicupin YhaK (pirin superfamily)